MQRKLKLIDENAFTLIEVLVVISILGIVITAIYSSFSTTINTWEKADEKALLYQRARGLSEKFTQDIVTAYYSPTNPNVKFLGKTDSLNFVSRRSTYKYGTAEIGYSFDENESLLKYRIDEVADFYVSDGGITRVLSEDIAKLEFKYYDSQNRFWDSYWSSIDKKGLPDLVKVSISFRGSNKSIKQIPPIIVQVPLGKGTDK